MKLIHDIPQTKGFINNSDSKYQRTMKCPCCGDDLICEKETEKTRSYRCLSCGLRNSELKKNF
ncbi:MAG TPA: hypothetical protein VJ772_01260 [Nitrososphaeraceae archaeon]|nr:hypothetical protein [Nitrososphaeraceae archaeon]